MNKVRPPRGRLPMISILSLILIVIGLGCISGVMFNVWEQSTRQNKLMEDSFNQVKSVSDIGKPAPDKVLYPSYPVYGDVIGSLTIPTLNKKLPIIQGTSVEELNKGVGHFTQSVLPGEEDNCVLSGHRETVFRQLGKLQVGDQLIVQTSAGTFTYEVNGTRIVHADDKTVIIPIDHAVLTLITCYPFNTPGYFPDRYIVSANLVKSL